MSGTVTIKKGSESALLGAVANVGPVAVAIDGSSNAFRVSVTCVTELMVKWSVKGCPIQYQNFHFLYNVFEWSLNCNLNV